MNLSRALSALLLVMTGLWTNLLSATPPPYINYQGVLRNASGAPLSGNQDMVFRFYDAATGNGEILIDAHTTAGMTPVVVTGGLFNALLGSGTVTDGMGPGVYTSLAQVFRDFPSVWLEIQVNTERLSPRVRIESSAYALNASHLEGKAASSFLDTSTAPQFKGGSLTVVDATPSSNGIVAGGTYAGGIFYDGDNTGLAYVGVQNIGIQASGASFGGHFTGSTGLYSIGNTGGQFYSSAGTGQASIAYGNFGLTVSGDTAAGAFDESGSNPRGTAWLGTDGYGIKSYGMSPASAGYFEELGKTGKSDLAAGDTGILARGSSSGGEFLETDTTAHAWIASGTYGVKSSGWVGVWSEGDAWGVYGAAPDYGGYFVNTTNSAHLIAGLKTTGLDAFGQYGGAFRNQNQDGQSNLAYNGRGIWGKGSFSGATFSDMLPDFQNAYWADVATPTRKIQGTGTVSFVQNHPVEKDKAIVYAAPEGDEVAVYTRGTARLVGGEARVPLGETFKWVANPDIGLTAQLTSRGEPVPLAVAALSPGEMLVKGPAGLKADVVFDYIVWGLRIGFEQLPIVQSKQREAFLPETAAVEAEYGKNPALRSTSAAGRFVRMENAAGIAATPGPARAQALADAINDGREDFLRAARSRAQQEQADQRARDETARTTALPSAGPPAATPSSAAPGSAAPSEVSSVAGAGAGALATAPLDNHTRDSVVTRHPLLPISESVTPGDLLAMDRDRPGSLRVTTAARDVTVAGCAASPDDEGMAAVALSGVVLCRADASYGAIRIGDLLTTSATPAHAMKADADSMGAILGKAMEPLEAGTGLIRVLIALR